MLNRHVSIQKFLNSYNTLDNYLRDLVGGSESRGMISLYKDTLDDPKEQQKLKTINKFRNELAHGVFPSDEPVKIDKSFVKLLDKHINYVKNHKSEVKARMLISIKNRKEKDLERGNSEVFSEEINKVDLPNQDIKRTNSSSVSNLPFTNILLENVSGIISIEDASCFICELDYKIENGTLYVNNASGVGRIGLISGQYDIIEANNVSGNIMIMTHKAKFKNVKRHNVSGIFHIADY